MGIQTFINKVCVQTAIYWAPSGKDKFGKQTYSTPADIKCRWDDKVTMIKLPDGRQIESKAQLLVTTEYAIGAKVMLGTLADYSDESDPFLSDPSNFDMAYEVIIKERNPMPKSTTVFVNQLFLGGR